MIVPSLITSSSNWRLGDLIRDVRAMNAHCRFDLFVLREVDIEQCERPGGDGRERLRFECQEKWGTISRTTDSRALAGLLGAPGNQNLEILLRYLDSRLSTLGGTFHGGFAAFATYFPWISSLDERRRELAVRAVCQTLHLAFEAAKPGRQWAAVPIVEIVCGNSIEACRCDTCKDEKRVFLAKPEEKRERLLNSLRSIVEHTKAAYPGRQFALALELEPGPSYILNNRNSVRTVLEIVRHDTLLKNHVGLNLDIAHMRLANVAPQWLRKEQLVSQIVHAHICDHPRMHTRDQPLGAWTATYSQGQFHEYVDLLFERDEQWQALKPLGNTDAVLPFSEAVAIELEGANQISWIHRSVNRLSRMLKVGKYDRDATGSNV